MALTATFEADFTAFRSEVESVLPGLAGMQAEADRLSGTLSEMADSHAPEALHGLAGATEEVTEANQRAAFSVEDFVKGYLTAEAILGAVTAAWGLLTDTIAQSLTSAAEAEDAQAGLTAALTAQGTAVPSVIAAYEQYASALQATTRYSDDAVTAAQKILVQIGGVMPRDMERATKATADLAAALGIDLESAAMMVAKAAEGQTSALQRAGVQIDTAKGQTADFATVLDTIEGKFQGQAATMANTYAGALDQLANAWDNVLESVGRAITSNETVRTALAAVNDLFKTNTAELTANATVNRLVSEAVILVAKGLGLAAEGLDFFQKELRDGRILVDIFNRELLHLYAALQGIELATQKPLAWAGSEEAKKRVEEATAAIEWAKKGIEGFNADMKQADATSQEWSASIQAFRGNLDTFIERLETTKGQTVEVTAAQTEAADVWDRQTGAISATTLATQEHMQALDLLEKSMWKIDTAATALARSREAAIVTASAAEVKARQDAEAAFWRMHDAEEAAMLQTAATASETVAAVGRIAETVVVQGNNISQAMSGWIGGWGGVGQLPTPTPGYNPATDAYAPWLQSTRMPNYLSGLAPPGSMYRDPRLSGFGGGETHVTVNAMYPIMDDPQAMNQLARVVGEAVMGRVTGTGTRV